MSQKVIGLIGGMSWESSAEYYRLINQGVRARLGGTHSAKCLMWSFDFEEIEALQHAGRWDLLGERLVDAARRLEAGGADALLICTNTMHKLAAEVEAAVPLPLLHIADCTAAPILQAGHRRVGLLGTAFTMKQDFYRGRLETKFGLDVLIPEADDRQAVHRIIYDELVQGRIEAASRAVYVEVMRRLVARGAEAMILGCTEISLLVGQAECSVPVFDTTALHAAAAVEFALGR